LAAILSNPFKFKKMKKIILILVAIFVTYLSNAQMHISANSREDYIWSKEKDNWVEEGKEETSNTLFDFNKEQTILTHTTATITTTYYIKSFKVDLEKNILKYGVVSDVGDKYLCILDAKNENIRFVREGKDKTQRLIRYTIKKIWFDD
jgi:hypothetical protein